MPSSERTMFATCMLLATCTAVLYAPVNAHTFYVKPGELQDALDKVEPGDTIELADGYYYESIVTKIDGEPDKYITIHGASYDAVLKGGEDGGDHIFDLQHSYYALDRFTIDGYLGDGQYVDKCLYVQTNREHGREAREIDYNGHRFRSSINGIAIGNMDIRNCGGECVRLRYFITYAQVYNNRIENCGTHDFVVDPRSGSKNGEGIYLGTSSNQWGDGKNPTDEPDQSQFNHFFDNHFETHGNEGLDAKEGATNNLIENNYCTAQLDEESACLDARGSGNIFRFNTIVGNVGAGVRLGGHEIDGYTYGEGNEVYGNYMENNAYAGVKILVGPQGKICDNRIEGSDDLVRGNEGEGIDPTESCPMVDDHVDAGSEARTHVERKPHLSPGSFRTGGAQERKQESDSED